MAKYGVIMNIYKCYHQLICYILCCQVSQVKYFYAYFGNEVANYLFNLFLIFLCKICTYIARLYAKNSNIFWGTGPRRLYSASIFVLMLIFSLSKPKNQTPPMSYRLRAVYFFKLIKLSSWNPVYQITDFYVQNTQKLPYTSIYRSKKLFTKSLRGGNCPTHVEISSGAYGRLHPHPRRDAPLWQQQTVDVRWLDKSINTGE